MWFFYIWRGKQLSCSDKNTRLKPNPNDDDLNCALTYMTTCSQIPTKFVEVRPTVMTSCTIVKADKATTRKVTQLTVIPCYNTIYFLPWWRRQMETFSALLAPCEGNPSVIGGFPSERPEARSFYAFLICAWTNGWANNRGTGDLRRHHAHYEAIVM